MKNFELLDGTILTANVLDKLLKYGYNCPEGYITYPAEFPNAAISITSIEYNDTILSLKLQPLCSFPTKFVNSVKFRAIQYWERYVTLDITKQRKKYFLFGPAVVDDVDYRDIEFVSHKLASDVQSYHDARIRDKKNDDTVRALKLGVIGSFCAWFDKNSGYPGSIANRSGFNTIEDFNFNGIEYEPNTGMVNANAIPYISEFKKMSASMFNYYLTALKNCSSLLPTELNEYRDYVIQVFAKDHRKIKQDEPSVNVISADAWKELKSFNEKRENDYPGIVVNKSFTEQFIKDVAEYRNHNLENQSV